MGLLHGWGNTGRLSGLRVAEAIALIKLA